MYEKAMQKNRYSNNKINVTGRIIWKKRVKISRLKKKPFGRFLKQDEKTIAYTVGLKLMEKWKIEMSAKICETYIEGYKHKKYKNVLTRQYKNLRIDKILHNENKNFIHTNTFIISKKS